MKKVWKTIVITAAVMAVTVFACNDGMSSARGTQESGSNVRRDKSQRTVIDASKYVDFTARDVNPARFTKQDIMYELDGTFYLEGGNSYIRIDKRDGTVTVSSDDAREGGKGGNNFFAKYRFDVAAAGGDCLYIKPGEKKGAQYLMNAESLTGEAVPDIAVCLPLYGFSRNRIEVSQVMDGYIAMPSGTYWARRN